MCQVDHMPRGTEIVTDPTTGKKYSFPEPVRDFVVHGRDFRPATPEEIEALESEPEAEEDPDC
jgi:hypothetical protein